MKYLIIIGIIAAAGLIGLDVILTIAVGKFNKYFGDNLDKRGDINNVSKDSK